MNLRFASTTLIAFALAAFLSSCAGSLRDDGDLSTAPVEFKQEMTAAEIPVADTVTASAPPAGPFATAPVAAVPGSPKISDKIIDAKVREKPEKAQPKSKTKAAAKAAVAPAEPTGYMPKDWPFGIGEKFELALRYGPIEGGLVTFEVLEPKTLNGETVLHYSGKVKSSKMLELFYKVDDVMETWVGLNDHLPRRQEIRQLETAHWGRRIVLFNQQKNEAKFYSHTTKKSGEVIEVQRVDAVTPAAQDVFGALYFFRFIENLDKLNFPIHDRWRNWANELRYLGRERVRVPMGEVETLHFKMKPRVQGNLEPKGDVDVWISDDPRRLIVQFKANIKVGSITGELKSYTPGRKPAIDPPRLRTPTSM